MIKPTQAQITAANIAYRTKKADHASKLIAALTAAAEVGETNQQMLERWDAEDESAMREAINATIERCAQVIWDIEIEGGLTLDKRAALVAAIRALKEKP